MKIFQLLIISIFMFILNIGLYYTSEGYRGFLQNIKGDKIIENIDDEYRIKEYEIEETLEEELNKKILNNREEANKKLHSKNSLIEKIEFVQSKVDKEIEKSDFFNIFLDKFTKYGLNEIENSLYLMNVTSEFPDDFFEYYSPKLTIYNFPTKNYNEVREIFKIESDGENFTINEVNNFGEESFFINLGKKYSDGFVRIIFVKNENVIGIKVLKNEYNSIKNIIK